MLRVRCQTASRPVDLKLMSLASISQALSSLQLLVSGLECDGCNSSVLDMKGKGTELKMNA